MTEDKKKNPNVIRLENVRLAFPQLFEAAQVQGEGKPAFSASFLLNPKVNANLIKKVKEISERVAKEKWKDKAPAVLKALDAADKMCLHDGNLKAEYDGYADNFFISARNEKKPDVVDRNKDVKLTAADGKPYAGCYVNASIEIWAQDNKFGKRINASLRAVQFLKDGDAFAGGAPVSEDELEDLSDIGEEDTGSENYA